MVEIKGSVIADSVKALKQRLGEAEYQRMVDGLDDETKLVFTGPIISMAWYSLDLFVRFLKADIIVSDQGNERALIARSEALIERQLRGIYKIFIRLGSPEWVLKKLGAIHSSYFRGVAVEARLDPGGKSAVVRYTGFESQHRLVGFSILGFFRKALEISGAKNIKAHYTTHIADGKGFADLSLSWS